MTTEERCEWLSNHLSMIKNNGVWCVPRCATIYRINHGDRVLIRASGPGDLATEELLPEIGWSLEVV